MSPQGIPHPPYIGVTGFMNDNEVHGVLEVFDESVSARLMVGVLVSDTTLGGQSNKHSHSFPKREEISNIFVDDPRVLNLLHFNTHNRDELLAQLRTGMKYGGPNCHGFQLNVAWPNPDVLC